MNQRSFLHRMAIAICALLGPACGSGGGGGGGVPPVGFSLLVPVNGQTDVSTHPVFAWKTSKDATTYLFELSSDPAFGTIVAQQAGLAQTCFTPSATLTEGALYYWRVTALNGAVTTDASGPWTFTTRPFIGQNFNAVLMGITDTMPPFLVTINPATAGYTKVSHEGLEGFLSIEGLASDPASGRLYGTDSFTGQLIRIDPALRTSTAIGFLGFDSVKALTYDQGNAKLYATDDNSFQLLSVSTTTGAATPVGVMGPFSLVHALSFDGTGVLYGIDASADSLITINTTTGAGTTVGTLGGGFGFVEGLTYDSDLNTLLGVDNAQSKLVTINKTTGAATGGATVPSGTVEVAFDTFAHTLYGTGIRRITTLNKATGQEISAFTTSFGGGKGLAVDPNANKLYGLHGGVEDLIVIDVVTGTCRTIGPLGFPNAYALGFNATTNTLYAADGFSSTLYSINTNTGQGTIVGSTGSLGSMRLVGMAFDAASNTMYAVDDFTQALVRVDLATGTATSIGSFPPIGFQGLAFDSTTRMLYTASYFFATDLYRIDPATAKVSKVGDLGIPVYGLTYDPVAKTLLATCYGPIGVDALFRVDPATARATSVGSMGYYTIHALGYDPFTKTTYAVYQPPLRDDYLLTVNPATGESTVVGKIGNFDVEALAFDTATRTMYASDKTGDQLLTINLGTGLGTVVGSFGVTDVNALASHPSTHTLFGISNGNRLVTINKTTGIATFVGGPGVLGSQNVEGMTFEPGLMVLYGMERTTHRIITINPATGTGALGPIAPRGVWDLQYR